MVTLLLPSNLRILFKTGTVLSLAGSCALNLVFKMVPLALSSRLNAGYGFISKTSKCLPVPLALNDFELSRQQMLSCEVINKATKVSSP